MYDLSQLDARRARERKRGRANEARYAERHKERRREKQKEYAIKNREMILLKKREYRAENRERIREKCREYRERTRSLSPDRIHRKKYGIGIDTKRTVFLAQRWSCGWCGTCGPIKGLIWNTDHDHVTDVIRGILCRGCNISLEHHVNNNGAEFDYRLSTYLSGERLAALTLTLLISEFYYTGRTKTGSPCL